MRTHTHLHTHPHTHTHLHTHTHTHTHVRTHTRTHTHTYDQSNIVDKGEYREEEAVGGESVRKQMCFKWSFKRSDRFCDFTKRGACRERQDVPDCKIVYVSLNLKEQQSYPGIHLLSPCESLWKQMNNWQSWLQWWNSFQQQLQQ